MTLLYYWHDRHGSFFILFSLIKVIRRIKFRTTILSFLFTFILISVFVFAIEIQQAVTQSGNMDFADVISGLLGFVNFFSVYIIRAVVIYSAFRIVKHQKWKLRKKTDKQLRNNGTEAKMTARFNSDEFTGTKMKSLNYRSKQNYRK